MNGVSRLKEKNILTLERFQAIVFSKRADVKKVNLTDLGEKLWVLER